MVVVANPSAGHGKAGKVVGSIERLLHEAAVPHEIVLSTSGPDLEEKVRAAAADGAAAIGCVGGDGTVGLAANALVGTQTPLAIFPSGTADDFAASLGIRHFATTVAAITNGVTERIDTARAVTGDVRRTFVDLLEPGSIDADFESEVRRFKFRGSSGKVNMALDALPNFTALPGEGEHLRGAVSISPTVDDMERAYDDAKYGRFSAKPYIDIVIPTLVDPSMAPPGST
jgi:diacylglycerol kinase family enzyme